MEGLPGGCSSISGCSAGMPELVVADGGSSDGSLQVLKDLAVADAWLRIISRSDRGTVDTLNKAFRAARGI